MAPPAVPGAPNGVAGAPAAAPATRKAPDPDTLQKQLDEIAREHDTSMRFRVDEESERVVVSVIDREGIVVMQIPDEAALDLARRLARSGRLLDSSA